MIKTEIISNELKRTYSDKGFMIMQEETGYLYEEAIDTIAHNYTYTETDQTIDNPDNQATAEDYENALKELGVE